MPTECSPGLFEFAPLEGPRMVVGCDIGAIMSDAGVGHGFAFPERWCYYVAYWELNCERLIAPYRRRLAQLTKWSVVNFRRNAVTSPARLTAAPGFCSARQM
jgi:hypothetical protein